MLITETVTIDEKEYIHNYSDVGNYIERDEILYDKAYDPPEAGYIYTESDTPIISSMDEDDAYALAGRILMGVI